MGISIRETHGVYILSGELDVEGAENFRIAMMDRPEGVDEVVLDLADVTFIDSIGARELVLFAKKMSRGIVLRYPQDVLLRMFELLELDEMPGIRFQLD